MGFEKFGKSAYISQAKILPLISFLEKGQIATTRCRKCKSEYFPPRADCLNCRSSDVEWVPLDGSCKLVTFTEVHFAPPAFQPDTPYKLGVAELTSGLRVFAPIGQEVDSRELKPGTKLVLRSKRAGEGVYYELGANASKP
jgi:uncharacterized protein